MTKRSIVAVMLTALLSSCASAPKPTPKKELPREELPPLYDVALPNEANVRFPGMTKAYAVNRYIDPANPSLMHERHVVYRREDGDRWKLDASRKQQVIVGPLLTDSRMERQSAPLTRELADDIRKSNALQKQYQDALVAQRRANEQIVRALGDLANVTAAVHTRLTAVESQTRGAAQASQVKAQPTPRAAAARTVSDDSGGALTEEGTLK